jgi:hypothetical protein
MELLNWFKSIRYKKILHDSLEMRERTQGMANLEGREVHWFVQARAGPHYQTSKKQPSGVQEAGDACKP